MIESIASEILKFSLTTLFGLGIGLLWKSHLLPFLSELSEKVKLHQNWASQLKFSSNDVHDIHVQINKTGQNITGELVFVSGKHKGKKYTISGRYHSHILTFLYYPVDEKSTSQGTATLYRKDDGNLLEGSFAYFSQDKNLIDTTPCQMRPIFY
ncbi:hypothetical protein [Spirosoma knui]